MIYILYFNYLHGILSPKLKDYSDVDLNINDKSIVFKYPLKANLISFSWFSQKINIGNVEFLYLKVFTKTNIYYKLNEFSRTKKIILLWYREKLILKYVAILQ